MILCDMPHKFSAFHASITHTNTQHSEFPSLFQYNFPCFHERKKITKNLLRLYNAGRMWITRIVHIESSYWLKQMLHEMFCGIHIHITCHVVSCLALPCLVMSFFKKICRLSMIVSRQPDEYENIFQIFLPFFNIKPVNRRAKYFSWWGGKERER